MSKVKFRTKLNIPENIFEAAEEAKRRREEERTSRLGRINFEPTPWSDYRQVAQMFDVIDVLIDFQGYVTGYSVSPDSRFFHLYHRFSCPKFQDNLTSREPRWNLKPNLLQGTCMSGFDPGQKTSRSPTLGWRLHADLRLRLSSSTSLWWSWSEGWQNWSFSWEILMIAWITVLNLM